MFKSVLILIIGMISIQFGAAEAKQLFPVLGVAGTSTYRLMFAGLMMALVFRPWKTKFSKEMMMGLIPYGASLGLMNFSFYFALQRIPLGIAVALEFLGPLAVAIFSSKKKIDYFWAVLAGIGILLLLPRDTGTGSLDIIGILLAILSGVFWALYIIYGKRAGQNLAGGIASSMGMIFAALVVLPMGAVIDGDKLFNTSAIPLALLVAFFGSALPYTLEMMALKKMPTQTFGVLMSLEPAVAALVGLIFLSESLTFSQWLAIFFVMISSVGSSLTQNEEKTGPH